MLKVSIVVPVYNCEQHLEKCLDSLVNQTLSEIEIIAVNDGSTDGSREILETYEKKYPEKLRLLHRPNGGQASARNAGLAYAKGEYIAFADSDDYLETDAYERAYGRAKEEDSDVLCFGFFEVKGKEKREGEYTVFSPERADVRYVLNETAPWNKLIRRSLWEEHSLCFTENRIYEDLELIPTLALYTKKIAFMEDRLYNYVIHPGSTMRQKVYNEKLASIYAVAEALKEAFSATEYERELEYLYIEHLLHGGVLRYLAYPEGKGDIKRIARIMKENFPLWRRNEYYRKKDLKYKIVCNLAYGKQIFVLKKLLKVK